MSIKSETHSKNIIAEENGIALVEITRDDAETQKDHRFYVVRIDRDRGQVYSAIPADAPDSGTWFGRISVSGIAYVANCRTYQTARRLFKKLSAEVA